jgi:hypothetical protein
LKKQQRIDKQTFKQIFIDHLEEFQVQNPRYKADYYVETVEKMLNCAEEEKRLCHI